MEVNVHHAKTHLSKLIAAVENGEEVVIARAGKPAVMLVVAQPTARQPRASMFGVLSGKITLPLDAEWRAMDSEIEQDFENSVLIPQELE